MIDNSRARRAPKVLLGAIALLALLANRNAFAQGEERAASAEPTFRSAITAQMTAASEKAHVSLMPGTIAYAGGEGGFVVNTAIQGADRFGSAVVRGGMDLLFVYVGGSGFAVPAGYYKVHLAGTQAQFIDANGKVVATLPANVQPAVTSRAKVKVKLTASWGKNGPEVDIEITFGEAAATGRAASIPIPARPTR